MKPTHCLIAIILLFSLASAQDPGQPDSIIVGSVQVDSGQTFCNVPIYAVTDDSVVFYNVPLRLRPPDGGVQIADSNTYYSPLYNWSSIFDSLIINQGYIREIGWASLDPSMTLNTGGLRQHIWDVGLEISPTAPVQTVTVDTAWDNINHSIWFGLFHGMVEFSPAFQRGYITILPASGLNDEALPAEYRLDQNYPNPFNAQTIINYSLSQAGHVTLSIYNIMGQKLATLVDGMQEAGEHRVIWNAGDKPSGGYFCLMKAGDITYTNKMLLLR
jgi:hypothetical protein